MCVCVCVCVCVVCVCVTAVTAPLEQVYTKTQAWTLIEFARVVFMDADQLVLQNIDEIMERPMTHRLAAVPDVAPPIFFNSGFMVLEPSLATFQDLQKKMHVLPSYDDGDQGFLNAYFGQKVYIFFSLNIFFSANASWITILLFTTVG